MTLHVSDLIEDTSRHIRYLDRRVVSIPIPMHRSRRRSAFIFDCACRIYYPVRLRAFFRLELLGGTTANCEEYLQAQVCATTEAPATPLSEPQTVFELIFWRAPTQWRPRLFYSSDYALSETQDQHARGQKMRKLTMAEKTRV